jgi:lambda family phage tail tape measure protein
MEFDDRTRGLPGALVEMKGETRGFAEEMREAARAMRGMDAEAKSLSRSLGSSLRSAFDKAIFGGTRLSEVFRGLASDVLGKSLDLALKPVREAISGGVGSLVGGLAGGIGAVLGFARGGALEGGRILPFADGAALDAGRVRAFARGGVVSGPTLFPLRGGTGLMGEAGPEAILPLSRGPDGRLGVTASGGSAPVINVTIRTPDVDGFRRSRGQVTAELARAVARGTGRL